MITIIYSTHKNKEYNDKFKQHLLQSVGLENVQILEYQNYDEFSLSQIYNSGITKSIYEVVVCCHNDIKLEKNWGKKLVKDFEENPDYGIIGKAGSCYFPQSGVYWERMHQTMVGQVFHHPNEGKKWLSQYSPKLPFLIPVVTIDGLFISFSKSKIKHKFDETIGKFHFYDHPFCLSNYLDGVKIGVTSSFEIIHQSVGQPNQEFFDSKEIFLKKFYNHLPIDLNPEKIYVPNIKEKYFKNFGKVAIIIPTKGNINLLKDCINSFYENCNQTFFDIFVADTGSTEEEKENIRKIKNIKLIEYDYYNFAKINNDVVKNYIDDTYEFLLFCNNDIKVLNNVIQGMFDVFKSKPYAGTVGCRLHYSNNRIQHDGILLFHNSKTNQLGLTHKNINNYYNHSTGIVEVIGNTGALLMIRKKLFIKCGMFNEEYSECFEDVELNLKSIIFGYRNFISSDSVSYHYESQSRNEDSSKALRQQNDYIKILYPFVVENLQKIKNYIQVL